MPISVGGVTDVSVRYVDAALCVFDCYQPRAGRDEPLVNGVGRGGSGLDKNSTASCAGVVFDAVPVRCSYEPLL